MNANVESESSNVMDTVKWILVAGILIGTVVANNIYAEVSVLLRAGVFVVSVAVCMFLASQTDKGRTFLEFAKESRTEVRRVIWPTRQEAVHTTMIIGAVTAITAIFLWGLDSLLLWAVGFVTGLRF
jgi:preprotein translocase subunit SecE